MNSKKFILESLNRLSVVFPEVKIRYELNIHSQCHIIEIIPLEVFEGNEDYMKAEAALEIEFEKLFPEEEIIFISEGSLTEITNTEYEFGNDEIYFDVNFLPIDIITNGYNELTTDGSENYSIAA